MGLISEEQTLESGGPLCSSLKQGLLRRNVNYAGERKGMCVTLRQTLQVKGRHPWNLTLKAEDRGDGWQET